MSHVCTLRLDGAPAGYLQQVRLVRILGCWAWWWAGERRCVVMCSSPTIARRTQSTPEDTLAERLRRRPAKPMWSPRVGSNPTGVDFLSSRQLHEGKYAEPRPRDMRWCVARVRNLGGWHGAFERRLWRKCGLRMGREWGSVASGCRCSLVVLWVAGCGVAGRRLRPQGTGPSPGPRIGPQRVLAHSGGWGSGWGGGTPRGAPGSVWPRGRLHIARDAESIPRLWARCCSCTRGQFARVVKGVDLRSTAGNCAWVRTP